jgi:cob(I)alamin adenosyltransferase
LGSGERRPKYDVRIEAYGTVDELNAYLGVARHAVVAEDAALDAMLAAIQNDLFDLGADLCVPPREGEGQVLRLHPDQVLRLEGQIDHLNQNLGTLRSFVLPGGTAGASHLHVARTVCRRAERVMVSLHQQEPLGEAALHYVNRLSDFLFVASRYLNVAKGDVLWVPGQHRGGS